MKDQNLFGAVDQVINTIDTEITCVKDEIEKHRKAIIRKQDEIEELQGRLRNLTDSMLTVRKDRPKNKAGKK